MNMLNLYPEVRIRLAPGALPPHYATLGAAGADIRAYLPDVKKLTVPPLFTITIPTGIFIELPHGYEAQIRPRSGIAASAGITILNSPGTIDSDYRGQIKILLQNTRNEPFVVSHGDRIAQMVISPVIRGTFMISESLSDSERGEGGFGSTGTN